MVVQLHPVSLVPLLVSVLPCPCPECGVPMCLHGPGTPAFLFWSQYPHVPCLCPGPASCHCPNPTMSLPYSQPLLIPVQVAVPPAFCPCPNPSHPYLCPDPGTLLSWSRCPCYSPCLLCPCPAPPTSLSPVSLSQYSMFLSLYPDSVFPLCPCPTVPTPVPPCTCTGPSVLVLVFPTSWSQSPHVCVCSSPLTSLPCFPGSVSQSFHVPLPGLVPPYPSCPFPNPPCPCYCPLYPCPGPPRHGPSVPVLALISCVSVLVPLHTCPVPSFLVLVPCSRSWSPVSWLLHVPVLVPVPPCPCSSSPYSCPDALCPGSPGAGPGPPSPHGHLYMHLPLCPGLAVSLS